MRVLVVEDEFLIRQDIAQMLRQAGHDVDEAGNGYAALECMRRQIPNVVVLDLRMPLMDGHHFRAEQLKHPSLATVPIILISATYAEAGSLGAVAKIDKPIRRIALLDAIERIGAPPRR
jgi:CheY-like chemotaxis protein